MSGLGQLEPSSLTPPAETKPSADFSRRSLLGEILDWMLAPLFLLWPMSIAITYVVAQNLANLPYDLGLANALQVLGQQIEVHDDVVSLPISAPARLALRIRENDGVFWKAIGPSGDLLGLLLVVLLQQQVETPVRFPLQFQLLLLLRLIRL